MACLLFFLLDPENASCQNSSILCAGPPNFHCLAWTRAKSLFLLCPRFLLVVTPYDVPPLASRMASPQHSHTWRLYVYASNEWLSLVAMALCLESSLQPCTSLFFDKHSLPFHVLLYISFFTNTPCFSFYIIARMNATNGLNPTTAFVTCSLATC